MDGILKYQRIRGAFEAIFEHDQITAVAIETNFLVIGTDSGEIHVVSFAGQSRQQYKPHDAPVNSLSVTVEGGLTILSCSDNGDVVLTACSSEEAKETSFQFDMPIKSVCFEESSNSSSSASKKAQLSFLAGAANGALIYRRAGWLKQKTVVLSPGSGTGVTEIRWRKSLVAWADLSAVRMMDIATQTAICRVSAPHGILPDDGISCRLLFRNDQDLLIAWGASFKVLHVEAATEESKSVVGGSYAISATTTSEWFADSIICGLFPFDRDHLALLCYAPPDVDPSYSLSDSLAAAEQGSASANTYVSACCPELVVANVRTGEVVYSSLLPLEGSGLGGPPELFFLSSYACADSKSDADKWSLAALNSRGADKGLAPLFFVFTARDAVIARLVDINDRISASLRQGHLRQAVEIAQGDRSALRAFSFHDLLLFYLDSLIKQRMAALAAKECARLAGPDPVFWEKAVARFRSVGQCAALCSCLPVDNPRLAPALYEDVLFALLTATDAPLFVQTVKRWAAFAPPLFAHDKVLALLHAVNTRSSSKLLACLDGRVDFAALQALQALDHLKLSLIEAEASLHLAAKNYDRVLSCYLDTDFNNSAPAGSGGGEAPQANGEYRNVFDLIEKNQLFPKVEAKIANLIRLSRPLSGKLLVNHVDRLPVRKIATALQGDAALLHWYLHLLFSDPATCGDYCDEQAFGDLHQRQLQLYIEFAPSVLTRQLPPPPGDASAGGSGLDVADAQYYRRHGFHSDLLAFVRAGLAPIDVAVRLCEAHSPPLYLEIILLQLLTGDVKRGLATILEELGNVALAVEYVEHSYEEALRGGGGGVGGTDRPAGASALRHGLRFPVTPLGKDGAAVAVGDPAKQQYIELWDELIRFVLKKDPRQLGTVLDYAAYCHIDPFLIVRAIRPQLAVPGLKAKVQHILGHLAFQRTVDEHTKRVLHAESVALIAQKNHGQRRAVKVSSQLRCKVCMRPLLFEPPALQLTSGGAHLLPVAKEFIQVWGPCRDAAAGPPGVAAPTPAAGADLHGSNLAGAGASYFGLEGAVIFSNKLAFHRPCYDRLV